jgi:exonuclease 3'-5' domain-containing protein 1
MDPSNYEYLRNRTLLFFIEKLISDQQQQQQQIPQSDVKKRTLHDLSCQFGSKGFTKEYVSNFNIFRKQTIKEQINFRMRQIAGGSQSGLKKFLSEYPSIFQIEGDLVTYYDTSAAAMATSSNTAADESSDYGKEAVKYFRERLLQYGIAVWVPIKSLLGHR